MNDHVNFLLCLRTLILKLYKNKTDLDVIIINEYVLNNSKYFTGTPETIRFIDALFYLCEDFKRENIKSFYRRFWARATVLGRRSELTGVHQTGKMI